MRFLPNHFSSRVNVCVTFKYTMEINFCLFFILIFLTSIKCENEEGPTINTPQGDIKGTWMTTADGRTIQAFLGIPYAKPPVGSLRFKDPESYGSWSTVRDGTKDPSVCPQPNFSKPGDVVGDEDCLYLNIYTPDTSKNGSFPVMVFIHGGSFVVGGCLSDMYGPNLLLDKDIVLVAFNYRIGILGFGSTEDDEIPGNFGLKDQVMALKWVQENVASYGGNPDSVTIFGICSGGVSVHFHMLSPLSKGLFHRGISMSGKAHDPWAISAPGTAAKYLVKSGELLNCSTSSSKSLRNCLSNLPVSSLVNVGRNFFVWVGMDPFTVFTPILESNHEGNFITLESFLSHSSLPMMSGVTSEEGAQKVAQLHRSPAGVDKLLKQLDEDFITIAPFSLGFEDKTDDPSEVALKIKEYFFKNKPINKEAIPALVEMYSDAYYYEGAKSANKQHDGPLFLYMFAYDGEHSLTESSSGANFRHGVAHADDLQYLFPLEKILKRPNGLSPEDKKTSKQLITYLTNFAENSNPTPNGELIEWTPMNSEDHNYLIINGSNTRMENNFLMEHDDFWESTNWLNKLFPESE